MHCFVCRIDVKASDVLEDGFGNKRVCMGPNLCCAQTLMIWVAFRVIVKLTMIFVSAKSQTMSCTQSKMSKLAHRLYSSTLVAIHPKKRLDFDALISSSYTMYLLVVLQHALHHAGNPFGSEQNLPGPSSTECILPNIINLMQSASQGYAYPNRVPGVGLSFMDGVIISRIVLPILTLLVRIL